MGDIIGYCINSAAALSSETPALLLLLLSCTAALASLVFMGRWTRGLHDLESIPVAPGGLPVLGHLLPLARHVANPAPLFAAWHDAAGPVLRVRLAHRLIVLVADPAIAAAVYAASGPSACLRRTPEYATFDVVRFAQRTGSRASMLQLRNCYNS